MRKTNAWRGATALFLSAAVGLTTLGSITDTWRAGVDTIFGTSSTVTTTGDKYKSDYKKSDDLVKAHEELGREVSQEGSVLLKNENNTLPMKEMKKVTLLGMGSIYPFLGGEMGSTVGAGTDLVAALKAQGVEVNPTMLDIYQTLGNIKTGEVKGWTGTTPVYGNRPAGFATPYAPSEPSLDTYTKSKDEKGGGAKENYADSFKDYSDAAIVVISRPGSEGSDYYPGEKGIDAKKYGTDSAFKLCENEKKVLEMAEKNFDKVIVLINSGSAMELSELQSDENIDAMMYIGFPGAYGFNGVVDLLRGEVSPSGHLSDTYVADNSKAPAAQNFGDIRLSDVSMIQVADTLMPGLSAKAPEGSFGGEPAMAAENYIVEAEGIYTGYKYYETRYFDSVMGSGNAKSAAGASNGAKEWNYDNEVVYPFGYGLSYTSFSQKLDGVKVDEDKKTVTAKVTVKNTGDVAAKDVAQLYVSVPYTKYDQEHGVEKSAVSFIGMEKTKTLKPGESQTVTIKVDEQYLASWDSTAKDGKGGYILDGGDYYFSIGNAHEAAENVLAAQGQKTDGNKDLTAKVTIGSKGKVDETTFAKSKNGTEVVNQLQNADVNYYDPGHVTYLSRSDWQGTFPKTYNDLKIEGDKKDEWVRNLANELYTIKKQGKVENLNGSGGSLKLTDLAGVDDLSDSRWEELVEEIPVEKLIPLIVKGGSQTEVISEIGSPLVFQNDGPNGFATTIAGRGLHKKDKNADYALNTMANETVLADTFNKELVEEFGKLLGNDGLWSGNYLIWADGVNLHRCAYNGRNFEYFSEDPMLSNVLAAAEVRGANQYGLIIGPKHFAFNDQETQRSGIATYLNEQKAREGELRAFQSLVEDENAMGLMASFTRIGATPVNSSVPLLMNILRGEWGFKGLLSTDMNNNAGYFRPEPAIAAGMTMIADFSTGETMKEVTDTWAYFTLDRVGGDEELVKLMRRNMIYQLYAFDHSAVQNVETKTVNPWWRTTLTVANVAAYALAALSAVMYILAARKKEEK